MFKSLFTFLLISLLALGPVTGFAAQAEVREGSYPDGAKMLYLCEGRSSVKFMLTLPDGKVYQGELFCGTLV